MVSACEAGIKPEEFWRLSWRELDNVLQAHRNNNDEQWRQIREVVAMSYNNLVSGGKHPKYKSGKEMIPLPSDRRSLTPTKPLSTLESFKQTCKEMGIKWNPIAN